MPLNLFNTLGKTVQEFQHEKSEEIKLYSCGPTVYNYVHIGNLRSYISADILKRTLDFLGYNVRWVVNITDIDDKTIAGAVAASGPNASVKDLRDFTDKYYQDFLSDLKKTHINANNIEFVRVTDKIADIQEFIIELIKKGYAYKAEDGSTYFSIEKYQKDFGDYGDLVGKKFLEGKKIGARIDSDEYDKENLSDFALWKAHSAEDAQIFWDHPELGKGRPGWHIECTLINYYKFPSGTDIHTGGIDLIFPHHTNEIAQAHPVYRPFVKHWVHSEHVLVDDKKMSKSAGNFFTLEDLEAKGIADGQDLRFLYLQSHYRSKLNVTHTSLEAAKNGLKNLKGKILELGSTQNLNNHAPDQAFLAKFRAALEDDLNTSQALAVFSEVLSSALDPQTKLATIVKFDEVLGFGIQDLAPEIIPDEIQNLAVLRDAARASKNYAESDRIRNEIENAGFEILDTEKGTIIKKK